MFLNLLFINSRNANVQRHSVSELGFGIPSQASISSIKRDSRKDGIGRHVSRMNKIQVEGQLAKLD